MGRREKPIYRDPNSGILFARVVTNQGKSVRVSLGTVDEEEAYRRLPVVRQTGISYDRFQKSLTGLSTLVVNQIDKYKIDPSLTLPVQPEMISRIITDNLVNGQAFFDDARRYWILQSLGKNLPTDATAMPATAVSWPISAMSGFETLVRGIDTIRTASIADNSKEIENFYLMTVPEILFKDKKRAIRFGKIWLRFLREKNIVSWNQITEELIIQFREWRKITPIERGSGNKYVGGTPSASVVNQHVAYLSKTFNKAVREKKLSINPIDDEWVYDDHEKQEQIVLSLDEFKSVLDKLSGTVQEIVIILFCANKRRKEICSLIIEDVNFKDHYCHYIEFKNRGKGVPVDKAFYLTTAMEMYLKRIIGNRTNGPVWPDVNPEAVSKMYEEAVAAVCSSKIGSTLKNIRQCCTNILEDAGLSLKELDIALGHLNLSKALPNYLNMSPAARYRRVAQMTQRGVEVLSKAVKTYLIQKD